MLSPGTRHSTLYSRTSGVVADSVGGRKAMEAPPSLGVTLTIFGPSTKARSCATAADARQASAKKKGAAWRGGKGGRERGFVVER